MVTVKLSGRSGGVYAPLLVGDTGMPLVEQCNYVESVFSGLLAHPELYPSPQNYDEVRYSLKGEDGTDLLTEECPVATSISEDDVARLQKGLDALKAVQAGALTTQRAAIEALRLPNFQRHGKFYRQCVDPVTGQTRLAILWGVGVRDELGQVVDDGPVLGASHSALVALLPPISVGDAVPCVDFGRDEGEVTRTFHTPPTEEAMPSTCKCWTVATVFLLVLALLAGLFYWWANRQYGALAAGQKTLADSLAVLGDQVDVSGKKLDKLAITITARLAATEKKLDETAAALAAGLAAADKKLEEVATVVGETEKRVKDLERMATDSAKDIQELRAEQRTLNDRLAILDGRVASVHREVESGPGGLTTLRPEIIRRGAEVDGLVADIDRIFSKFPDLGTPLAPVIRVRMEETFKEPVAGPTYAGSREAASGAIREATKDPKKPPPPDVVTKGITKVLEDRRRRIEFPEHSFPGGVVPPKWEDELLDDKKWTVPPDVKTFEADGVFVDNQNPEKREPFRYHYRGRGGVVGPPAPKVSRTEYEPANPADRDKLNFHPDKPPTVKEGSPPGVGIPVQRREFGEDGGVVGQGRILVTPSASYALPFRTTWTKQSGDADVPDVYVGDTPPPLRTPGKVPTIVVFKRVQTDANGKLYTTSEVKQVYEPQAGTDKK